ncbi:unnamed protein product [Spirodela intermedia]|uniref:Uncharacterized protein n=1 Tax=Spirodela intermedia TaxID=51605 RepID=A0A7I8L5Q4_SPIIN|nr:unnamed protein product [Spirodela intermedia]
MAFQRLGDAGLSELGLSNQSLAYGVHGMSAPSNFFDQEGSSYIGELEEALMQGVVGARADADRKSLLQARPPPTLEIFPSWPMSFQSAPRGNSQSSTDSGSAQRITVSSAPTDPESPVSRKAPPEWKQRGMAGSAGRTVTSTVENHQPKPPKKRKDVEKDGRPLDPKTLRRLAQNREAARKSRLRKKAYVQQLETSRVKLAQLEQDLQRARSQGSFFGGGGAGGNVFSSGAAIFDVEYARWLEDDDRYMAELRRCLQARLPDGDLRVVVDECLNHHDEIFRLKDVAMKSDVFHLISGAWATPAERCFMWVGGFRPSEILKILTPKLDPLTEQQLVGIGSLQQSSQQTEEVLSQGLDQLQRSMAEAVAGELLCDGLNVGNHVNQMAAALGKVFDLEGFLRQADNLRQETLHQMRRILTIRQGARCFLAIGEYHSRLRSLSSLWASSRPEEASLGDDGARHTSATDMQVVHQHPQGHFSPF